MRVRRSVSRLVIVAVCASCAVASDISRPLAAGQAPAAQGGGQLQVPVEYFKLKNGLKVVLSRDMTTPLWMAQFFHDATTPSDKQLAAIDAVLERVRKEGLDQATLDRARVKMRSGLYADLEQFAGFGRANLLASFALFDDDPSRINRLEAEFAKVTPALVQKTASEYLRPGNRTVYVITPGTTGGAEAAGKGSSR